MDYIKNTGAKKYQRGTPVSHKATRRGQGLGDVELLVLPDLHGLDEGAL